MTYQTRPGLRIVCPADDWAVVITEAERRRVVGRLYAGILAELVERAGSLDFDELERRLGPRFGAAELLYGLQQLVDAGYVVEAEPPAARAADRARPEGPAPAVSLQFLGDHRDPVFARTFEECGLELTAHPNATTVVVVEDYLDPRLTPFVNDTLAAGRACVPFKPYGNVAWLGPAFAPGGGACWACVLHRVQVNRPVEMYLHGEGRPLPSVLPRPQFTGATLASASLLAGRELARALRPCRGPVAAAPAAPGELLTLDLEHMQRAVRTITRRPQCPRCGDPDLMTAQLEAPVQLAPRKKHDTGDGGHRIESAESTYRRLSRHVDPLVGPVSSLREMASKTHALRPVFSASHYVRPAPGRASANERFEQISVGKGKAAAQARASALCEALERQGARFQGDEPRLRGSHRELSPATIDPRELLLFSERQYAQGTPSHARSRLLATPRSQLVPRPFDPGRPIDWAPAWSLTRQARRLVPFAYLFAGAPQPDEEQFCSWDSNGCAAGNCLEEAVLQGLLELVERDATAVWWYNRVQRPGIDLESFDEPYFVQVREHYAEAGHEIWLLDLTHDLEIPVVIALASERGGERYAAGLGCHLDFGMAAQRALTELHQVFDPERRHAPLFARADVAGDDRFLRPAPELPMRPGAAHPAPRSDDLRDDVELCLDRLHRAGLEVLVANYSRPDVELATVKVMVPGLRHFWPRFAPGRLYDVPVRLGWLDRALDEPDLNPTPLLL